MSIHPPHEHPSETGLLDDDDTISVTVLKAGISDGDEVVLTTASSNHYTSASFTADTCCSCEKS